MEKESLSESRFEAGVSSSPVGVDVKTVLTPITCNLSRKSFAFRFGILTVFSGEKENPLLRISRHKGTTQGRVGKRRVQCGGVPGCLTHQVPGCNTIFPSLRLRTGGREG